MHDDRFERRLDQIHDPPSPLVRGSLVFLGMACCEALVFFGVGSLGGWCLGIIFWGVGILLVLATTLNGVLYGLAGIILNLRRPREIALAVIGIALNAALLTACMFIPYFAGLIK
jgi:hypothetical protein